MRLLIIRFLIMLSLLLPLLASANCTSLVYLQWNGTQEEFGLLDPETGTFTFKGIVGDLHYMSQAGVSDNTLYVRGTNTKTPNSPYFIYTLDITTGQLLSKDVTTNRFIIGIDSTEQLMMADSYSRPDYMFNVNLMDPDVFVRWNGSQVEYDTIEPETGKLTLKGVVSDIHGWGGQQAVSDETLYVIGPDISKSYFIYTLDMDSGQILSKVATSSTYQIAGAVALPMINGKCEQTVAFNTAPKAIPVDITSNISAISDSGLKVKLSSDTPKICAVNGSTVKGITEGNCIIAANQPGNAKYNAATKVTKSITIGSLKSDQYIKFNKISMGDGKMPLKPEGNRSWKIQFLYKFRLLIYTSGTLSATATSGLEVSFSSTTPTICTVNGSHFDFLTEGICIIAANQAGNGDYKAAAQVIDTVRLNIKGRAWMGIRG